MFRFIHAADIHLDSPLTGLDRYESAPVDAIRHATRRAFENLIQVTIDEHAAFLLIAGDLYDGDWKDYRTGLFFAEQMSKLREAEIPVFIVAGNHDAQSQLTKKLRAPANVHFFSAKKPETCAVEKFGVAIHGQGFLGRAVTENLAVGYPPAQRGCFNIGLLHTSLDGSSTHDTYAPAELADLIQKGYDYWALGHVHNRQVISSDPWVIFSGNLQGRHAREPGAKSCSVVTVDGIGVKTVEERFVDVARFVRCNVDVEGVSNTADVLDRVSAALVAEGARADGRLIAVRVHIAGATSCHDEFAAEPEHWVEEIRALAASVSSTDVWIERVRFGTERRHSAIELAKRDDVIGTIVRSLGTARDDEERQALEGSLTEVRSALPRDLLEMDDGVDLRSPAVITQLIDEARDLLVARFSRQGVRP